MGRSRDGHTGAGKTWLARASVLALAAATLTVPLGIITGAEAARLQPRTTLPTSTLAVIKTISGSFGPEGVAINSEDDTVYVTNYGVIVNSNLVPGNNVQVIDGRTGTISGTNITVGSKPFGVAVDQSDDTVYVANEGGTGVSVIDGATRTVTAISPVGNNNSKGIAVDQGDDTVYVAANGNNNPNIYVISGRAAAISGSAISAGDWPWFVAVDQNDDTVYATASQNDNQLTVINGRTRLPSGSPIPLSTPRGVAVDQSDDTVYVASSGSNNVLILNGRSVDDSRTVTVGNTPYGVAVDQNDDTVYVTNSGSNYVSVINGRTGLGTDDTVTVGSTPHGIAVDDSGTNAGLVYVANYGSNTVSVIGRVVPTLPLGSRSGSAGITATINLDVPQVDYDVDDSTITSIAFGGTPATGLAAGAGDTWTVTVPAGSGTVAVTVTFKGGRSASAGDFTYDSTPTPTPPPPPPPAPLFPPDPPTAVTAVAGDDTALVSWTPPVNIGAGPITSYYVFSTPRTGSCSVTPPATSCVMTGLTNGTTYTFQVQAINIDGASSPSIPSNEVTPGVTPPPPPPPTPTITITGSRDAQRIVVTGTSTELTGKTLRPWIRFPGQTSYSEGLASITPSADGTFTWSRKTGKKTSVYIAHETTKSNSVTIPAR